ncbi:MAG: isochorismatase family protein [Methanobacteriaceae archaeon]|nr:isochorismatase family protein [Methanobacteriaceae archaeon]
MEKQLHSSFTGTKLNKFLKDNSIDTITIAGFMTQMCCDTTAKEAMHRNYHVEFLNDATGTINLSNNQGKISAKELHETILIIQASRFSEVLSTQDWIKKIGEK